MKIAILGAPGSGKTKVARKAVKLLNEPTNDWAVVDGYVDKLINDTGISYGAFANFPQNLSVITTRWIKEEESRRQGRNTLTCGSIYESILYTTFTTMFSSPDEGTMMREDMFNGIMMQALGAIEKTTYEYDAMFLLHYDKKTFDAKHDTWEQVVDAKLPEVLSGFNKNVILLDQKTDKAKAESIVEVVGKINEYYASILAENEQPTV